MKLTELELRGFTAIEKADFSFASGVNVIIGENGTGKSHVLKVLYALLNAVRAQPATRTDVERDVRERLAAVFRPDDGDVSRLVRAGADSGCQIWLKSDRGETMCQLSEQGAVTVTEHTWKEAPEALFIPTRDVLAMFENFVAVYEEQELSFDETYRDICVALQRPRRRGKSKMAADELAAPIQELLGGEVEMRGTRFYVDIGDGPREAHLAPEGLRKIAALAHLASNGSIREGGILFWDEPEANLNPRIIAKVARVIRDLAARGVQIFLATHDYLLSHKLSLAMEYGTDPKVDTRFFSLYHARPTDPVLVESGLTLAQIENNSILDEYAQHYDDERELFRQEMEREGKGKGKAQ